MNRRALLHVIGAASVAPLVGTPWKVASEHPPRSRKVVVVKPDENRFPYANVQQAERSPCKLTSADSDSVLSMFELNVASHAGPVRHLHHREDEWCYVLKGEFLFEAGNEKITLPVGGSIWMPRGIPHVWANTSDTSGKLLVACQPGGFEKFFDALGSIPEGDVNDATIKRVMAKYGMEVVGPPLFGLWRQQRGQAGPPAHPA